MAALAPEFVFVQTERPRNQRELSVKIMLDKTEVGHFDFIGNAPLENEVIIGTKITPLLSSTEPISLGIGIDEEYQDRGWSTPMIAAMIEFIGNRMSDDQELVIDTDASDGYWKHLGFQENRHYRQTKVSTVGQGYEAFITMGGLKAHIMPRKGGKRTRRKKKKSKVPTLRQ